MSKPMPWPAIVTILAQASPPAAATVYARTCGHKDHKQALADLSKLGVSRSTAYRILGLEWDNGGTSLDHLNAKPVQPGLFTTAPAETPRETKMRQKKRKYTDPMEGISDEDQCAFVLLWQEYPEQVEAERQDQRGRVNRFNTKVKKGNLQEAQQNFCAIIQEGVASGYELYAAMKLYIERDQQVKEGYVQHIATFLGPKKQTFKQYLKEAKELVHA